MAMDGKRTFPSSPPCPSHYAQKGFAAASPKLIESTHLKHSHFTCLKLGPKIEDQIQFSVSLTGTHSLSSRSGKFIRSHTQLRPTGASHEKNRCTIFHARPGSYDDYAVGELSVGVGLGKPHQIFHLHPFEADSILGPHCRKNGK